MSSRDAVVLKLRNQLRESLAETDRLKTIGDDLVRALKRFARVHDAYFTQANDHHLFSCSESCDWCVARENARAALKKSRGES